MPYIREGQEKIQYVLSRRAKKYINITLKSNGIVYVSAPKRVPMCEVERVLGEKLEWIRKNIKEKHEEKVYTKEDYNNAKIAYSLEVEKWLRILSKYNIKMPEIISEDPCTIKEYKGNYEKDYLPILDYDNIEKIVNEMYHSREKNKKQEKRKIFKWMQ